MGAEPEGRGMREFVEREDVEARERATLASFAMAAADSRGRRHPEPPDRWRTDFQRDRDRIIHTNAFRRLESKTQVFVSRTGDHYRTRLTHTIEVAQISRSIARILGLNEDLTEAVALAHDLGHAPFGHSGGDVLERVMRDHGGFEHNQQALRLLDSLEERYPGFPGLNLTYEVRESILKHHRPFRGEAYADYHPEEGPLLEAQIVDVCDGIAYNSHDLDDGLKAGLLRREDVERLSIWSRIEERLDRRFPGVTGRMREKKGVAELINMMVADLVTETRRRITEGNITRPEDCRATVEPLVGFSEDLRRAEHELRGFLYERFYTHPEVQRMRRRARIIIEGLFGAFVAMPSRMPETFVKRIERAGLERTVADYIAGMTDSYAQAEYERLLAAAEEG
ncbi:MAG: deoxyguanosinetriphosphate triphosphohydrolase [Planctomycetota bacterium]